MSKIKPGGVVGGNQFGTTFHDTDTHAPTLKGSNTTPKDKIKANGVEGNSPQGTTFQGNRTHIKMGNADKKPSTSKVSKSAGAPELIDRGGKGLQYGGVGTAKPSVKNPPVK